MFWWIPFLVQALAIAWDEGYFHLRRGLPQWERMGHPLDTLSVLLCIAFALFVPFSPWAVKFYTFLAILSCLLVTKDEFVHKHHCPAAEQWLHALLFLLHPMTLLMAGAMWPASQGVALPEWVASLFTPLALLRPFLVGELIALSLFFLYQIIFWNFVWNKKTQ